MYFYQENINFLESISSRIFSNFWTSALHLYLRILGEFYVEIVIISF